MRKRVVVGQLFEDVEIIHARRNLRRENLICVLSIAVVGSSLVALAVAGVYGLVTTNWGPIGTVHDYAIPAITGILGAVVGSKPSFGNSS